MRVVPFEISAPSIDGRLQGTGRVHQVLIQIEETHATDASISPIQLISLEFYLDYAKARQSADEKSSQFVIGDETGSGVRPGNKATALSMEESVTSSSPKWMMILFFFNNR
jgi:hypothetical protein